MIKLVSNFLLYLQGMMYSYPVIVSFCIDSVYMFAIEKKLDAFSFCPIFPQ